MGGSPSRQELDPRGSDYTGGSLEEARLKVKIACGGVVQVAATEILRVAGVAAFHTSVIVGDKEYYFDSQGIISAPTLWSHALGQSKRPQDFKTEVFNYGPSLHSGPQLVHSLQSFFEKGSYDVLHKNCNVFTDAALYYLSRRRLESRFSRLERLLVATEPFSTEVMNRLLLADAPKDPPVSSRYKASPGRLWPGPYCVNPRAEHFSVEHVIAACDVINAAEAGRSTEHGVCGCVLDGWNCVNVNSADEGASRRDDGPETAIAVEASDTVDVDESVTRAASLLPLKAPPELGLEEKELHYWDFELDDDDHFCEEAVGESISSSGRTVPLHEIVGEAWEVTPLEQEDPFNASFRCPVWSAQPLPCRGTSLHGTFELPGLDDLEQPREQRSSDALNTSGAVGRRLSFPIAA